MKYVVRLWTKTTIDGWTSEFDTFENIEDAKNQGEAFVENIRYDELDRTFEIIVAK